MRVNKKRFQRLRDIFDIKHKCAICHKEMAWKDVQVDHCHETDTGRGLLCKNCNVGLGHFRDDPEVLIRAAKYVVKHAEKVYESDKAAQPDFQLETRAIQWIGLEAVLQMTGFAVQADVHRAERFGLPKHRRLWSKAALTKWVEEHRELLGDLRTGFNAQRDAQENGTAIQSIKAIVGRRE